MDVPAGQTGSVHGSAGPEPSGRKGHGGVHSIYLNLEVFPPKPASSLDVSPVVGTVLQNPTVIFVLSLPDLE